MPLHLDLYLASLPFPEQPCAITREDDERLRDAKKKAKEMIEDDENLCLLTIELIGALFSQPFRSVIYLNSLPA